MALPPPNFLDAPRDRRALGYEFDRECMYRYIILRLHRQGLPESRAEFVAEVQSWFMRRAENDEGPDKRSILRRVGPHLAHAARRRVAGPPPALSHSGSRFSGAAA